MFTKILIANRGEIALRVIRTCRDLGVRTVALYTELDAGAPHLRAADEAVLVGNYLDIDEVVAAALGSGAEAVHPGYGFLSERADFAHALDAAGIALIGPSADVMDAMGRKDKARAIAVAAGVPVVPSYGIDDDPTSFAYPVLVKAAAGGGGKGMRVVRAATDLPEAMSAARREAAGAFGDDTLLIEKYVESGRHLEVQVMGDQHGQVLHFFERDCSTQRRHQKVLEEAPAPTIDQATRARITTAAVDLAREVGYTGAGTVEFLLDNTTGDFYFLEMNTRLQVEHPVTELITGADLVALQLRVAAGEELDIAQDSIAIDGHAIEARVYAEDSYGGFLPQAGTTTIVRWPDDVRVDHALGDNQVVSTSYDPMLGKVIAHGPDRESARQVLIQALDRTAVLGLTTNTGFLRALVAGEEFRDARIDTAWLDTAEVAEPSADTARVIAAWTQAMLTAGDTGHPYAADGWRLGAEPAAQRIALDREVVVDRHNSVADGLRVRELAMTHHVADLIVDGRRVRAVINATAHEVDLVLEGQRFRFTRPDVTLDQGAAESDGSIIAPMPGTVLDVRVAAGDRVEAGQVLGVIEAMKMELSLKAPFDGVVDKVAVRAGAQVAMGAELFTVTDAGVPA